MGIVGCFCDAEPPAFLVAVLTEPQGAPNAEGGIVWLVEGAHWGQAQHRCGAQRRSQDEAEARPRSGSLACRPLQAEEIARNILSSSC